MSLLLILALLSTTAAVIIGLVIGWYVVDFFVFLEDYWRNK